MYKTETHLHTAEVSVCGKIPAQDMIRAYKEQGYHTIFVSDHFYAPYFEKLGDIPWAEKIDAFLEGYRLAKECGDSLGICVLLSAELRLDCVGNDYLLYGIDEEMLKDKFQGIFRLSQTEMKALMDSLGVFVVQAHPYRAPKCVPDPANVDAFEVVNSNPRHYVPEDTLNALKTAEEHGLHLTGGSDAHREEDIAGGGVCTREEIRSAADYIAAVKGGKACVIGL